MHAFTAPFRGLATFLAGEAAKKCPVPEKGRATLAVRMLPAMSGTGHLFLRFAPEKSGQSPRSLALGGAR